jgi:hypothetical protein
MGCIEGAKLERELNDSSFNYSPLMAKRAAAPDDIEWIVLRAIRTYGVQDGRAGVEG